MLKKYYFKFKYFIDLLDTYFYLFVYYFRFNLKNPSFNYNFIISFNYKIIN
jgi:hypothetical protein